LAHSSSGASNVSRYRSPAPWPAAGSKGAGADHEDERSDTVAVRNAVRDAATRAGRRCRQQQLDALPQLRGEESVYKPGHARSIPRLARPTQIILEDGPERPLSLEPATSIAAFSCGPVRRLPSP
jgi:hypothetical protein